MEGKNRILPLAIVKISSNDGVPLLYFPKEVQRRTGIRKGQKVMISLDEQRRILIEPLILPEVIGDHNKNNLVESSEKGF